jgi:peptidoglycan hydrolase-like protein with peptidoglycan-binding domain
MFLASKVALAGIVFLLLATGISRPRPTPLTSAVDLSKEAPAVPHPNDVMSMQQTLIDKGHYRGKVDGVFGLRTRASIRAYQKAENLPVTGQLDNETAGRLGVGSEVRQETRFVTTQDKPPAGTKWAKGSGRTRKTPQKSVEKWAAPTMLTGDHEKALQPRKRKPVGSSP